jgi:hypothetical protein
MIRKIRSGKRRSALFRLKPTPGKPPVPGLADFYSVETIPLFHIENQYN